MPTKPINTDEQTLSGSNLIDIEEQLTFLESLGRIPTQSSDELISHHSKVPAIKNIEIYAKALTIAFSSQFSRFFLFIPGIFIDIFLRAQGYYPQVNKPSPSQAKQEEDNELYDFFQFSLGCAVLLNITLLAMHHLERKDNLHALKTQSKPKLLFFRRQINNHPMTAFFTLQLASSLVEHSLEPSPNVGFVSFNQYVIMGNISVLSAIALFQVITNDYLKLFAAFSFCKQILSPIMEKTSIGIKHTTNDCIVPCLKKTGQRVLPPLTGIISKASEIGYENIVKPLEKHLEQDSNIEALKIV